MLTDRQRPGGADRPGARMRVFDHAARGADHHRAHGRGQIGAVVGVIAKADRAGLVMPGV